MSAREANTGVLCNFHEAILSLPGQEKIRVLCNAYSPLVAFVAATVESSEMDLTFINYPLLANTLQDQWTVLTTEELQEFPGPDVLSLLGKEELNQLKYWKPQAVGHVIFNYWD